MQLPVLISVRPTFPPAPESAASSLKFGNVAVLPIPQKGQVAERDRLGTSPSGIMVAWYTCHCHEKLPHFAIRGSCISSFNQCRISLSPVFSCPPRCSLSPTAWSCNITATGRALIMWLASNRSSPYGQNETDCISKVLEMPSSFYRIAVYIGRLQ